MFTISSAKYANLAHDLSSQTNESKPAPLKATIHGPEQVLKRLIFYTTNQKYTKPQKDCTRQESLVSLRQPIIKSPMIYLIGALPRCGKTTLVKQMSRKTNISWLSSDTLDSIAQEYTTSKDWKMKFPYSHLRQISKTRNNDDFYSEHSPTKIINTIKFLIS